MLGLARDGQQVPYDKSNNTAALDDTDRADNRGLDTVFCKPPLMCLCSEMPTHPCVRVRDADRLGTGSWRGFLPGFSAVEFLVFYV